MLLESENGETLAEIVRESMKMSKELYKTSIYAVVSDNASPMIKMGELLSHIIWHSTCSSHTANLLCKDVLDKNVIEQVTSILKEFKHTDHEKLLIQKGGKKVKLPCEVRWCSYRDSFLSSTENLKYMKVIAADENTKKIKENAISLLFNNNFVEQVKENIQLIDPICKLINLCQSSKFSIADAANLWLHLELPDNFENKFKGAIRKRKNMGLNIYALVAYYLHPDYDNNDLPREAKQQINRFFLKHLSSNGLEELDLFQNNFGIFEISRAKKIGNPILFWNLTEVECPNLAGLAIKLLKIQRKLVIQYCFGI
ncbi:hypothetical protein QE152_g30834 [Popillia japonica]|uniref:DUF659 domain-containing protein n=1 Tax=Popillia japonica TaxID=7064 RepID=A0AAW1JD54_POPJA